MGDVLFVLVLSICMFVGLTYFTDIPIGAASVVSIAYFVTFGLYSLLVPRPR